MNDTGRGIIRPHLNGGKDRRKSQRHYQFTIFPTDVLIHGFRIHIHPSGGMVFEFDNRQAFNEFDARFNDATRKMKGFLAQEERVAKKMNLNLDGYHIYLSGLSRSKYEAHQEFLEREMKEFYAKEYDRLSDEGKAALVDAPPQTFDTVTTRAIIIEGEDEFPEMLSEDELIPAMIENYFREGNDEQNPVQPDATVEQVRESTEVCPSGSGNTGGYGQTTSGDDESRQQSSVENSSSHESVD